MSRKRYWWHSTDEADEIVLKTGFANHLIYLVGHWTDPAFTAKVKSAEALARKCNVPLVLTQLLHTTTESRPESLTDPRILEWNLKVRVSSLGIDCLTAIDVECYAQYLRDNLATVMSPAMIDAVGQVDKFDFTIPECRRKEDLPVGVNLDLYGGTAGTQYNVFPTMAKVGMNELTYRKGGDKSKVNPKDVIGRTLMVIPAKGEYTPVECTSEFMWPDRDLFFFPLPYNDPVKALEMANVIKVMMESVN